MGTGRSSKHRRGRLLNSFLYAKISGSGLQDGMWLTRSSSGAEPPQQTKSGFAGDPGGPSPARRIQSQVSHAKVRGVQDGILVGEKACTATLGLIEVKSSQARAPGPHVSGGKGKLQGRKELRVYRFALPSGERLAFRDTVQFHFDKAVDALKLGRQGFHAEGDKFSKVRARPLRTAVQDSVVLNFVFIEEAGKRMESVAIVAAPVKNGCGNQPGNTPVAIRKWMDGCNKESGHKRMDHGRQASQSFSIDELNIPLHPFSHGGTRSARMEAGLF